MSQFDFDSWARLAKTDPAAFERARRDALMQAVAAAPEAQRVKLAALVEKLTAPVTGEASALERAVAAHNAMMDGVHALHQELGRLQSVVAGSVAEAPVAASLEAFTRLETRRV